jgi:alkylation response protein AidB-like acyl-CoA dehydrogenase
MKHTALTSDHVALLSAAARDGIRRESTLDDFWIARGAGPRSRKYWREHVDQLIRLGYLRVTVSSTLGPGDRGPVACRATPEGIEALGMAQS